MIATLYVHRTPVQRPHGFTAHRMQRMFLTRRHATRMSLPAPIAARRALAVRAEPAPVADCTQPAGRSWSSLASVLLMVAIVVVAVMATGVRL